MKPTLILSPDLNAREERLGEIRRVIASPAGRSIWSEIEAAARSERTVDPYLPDTIFPGRDAYSAELRGIDYILCRSVGNRPSPAPVHLPCNAKQSGSPHRS